MAPRLGRAGDGFSDPSHTRVGKSCVPYSPCTSLVFLHRSTSCHVHSLLFSDTSRRPLPSLPWRGPPQTVRSRRQGQEGLSPLPGSLKGIPDIISKCGHSVSAFSLKALM